MMATVATINLNKVTVKIQYQMTRDVNRHHDKFVFVTKVVYNEHGVVIISHPIPCPQDAVCQQIDFVPYNNIHKLTIQDWED